MATGEQGDITRSELKKNWGVLTALVSKDFKILSWATSSSVS